VIERCLVIATAMDRNTRGSELSTMAEYRGHFCESILVRV
jgi:hypothetical protein